MKYKLLLVIGLVTGYILGARAGRARFEQIKTKATDAWEDPRVQKVVADTQEFVKENAPLVQERVVSTSKAAVAGAQDTYRKTAETSKELSGKLSNTAKDVSGRVAETTRGVRDKVVETAQDVREKVVGTANEFRDSLGDRGEEVVDGVIIAAVKARDSALEEDLDE